jgi:glycosyltransferase involved in cell wall biosynthesis
MLVTNVGGLGEIVPHNKAGYVVEPTPEAIAEAVNNFFENDRFEEMSAFVEKEKARFSWASLVEKFEEVKSAL